MKFMREPQSRKGLKELSKGFALLYVLRSLRRLKTASKFRSGKQGHRDDLILFDDVSMEI